MPFRTRIPPDTCAAVLFDLDGVLVDSAACIERHWRRWGRRHGLDLDRLMALLPGRRMVEIIRYVAPHLDAEAETGALSEEEGIDTKGVFAVAGAAALLRSLPPASWAVVTSGNRLTAMTRLRHTRLPDPPVLVTADDVRQGKPHPEPYLTAARRLGVPAAECLVVEDAPAGIEAARAAGMRVVGLATTHAPAALARADAVASHLEALRLNLLDDASRIGYAVTG